MLQTICFSLALFGNIPYDGFKPGNNLNCDYTTLEGCIFYPPESSFGPDPVTVNWQFILPTRIVVDSGVGVGEYLVDHPWRPMVWFSEFNWGLGMEPLCPFECPAGFPSGGDNCSANMLDLNYTLQDDCAWYTVSAGSNIRVSPNVEFSEQVWKIILHSTLCGFDGELLFAIQGRQFDTTVRLGTAPTSPITLSNNFVTYLGETSFSDCDLCARYGFGCVPGPEGELIEGEGETPEGAADGEGEIPPSPGTESFDIPRCPDALYPLNKGLSKNVYPLGGQIVPTSSTVGGDPAETLMTTDNNLVYKSEFVDTNTCYFCDPGTNNIRGYVGPSYKSYPVFYISARHAYSSFIYGTVTAIDGQDCNGYGWNEAYTGYKLAWWTDPESYVLTDCALATGDERGNYTFRFMNNSSPINTSETSNFPASERGFYEFRSFSVVGGRNGMMVRKFPSGQWAVYYQNTQHGLFSKYITLPNVSPVEWNKVDSQADPDTYLLPLSVPSGYSQPTGGDIATALLQRTIAEGAAGTPPVTAQQMTEILKANQGSTAAAVRDGVKAATGHVVKAFQESSGVTAYAPTQEQREAASDDAAAARDNLAQSVGDKLSGGDDEEDTGTKAGQIANLRDKFDNVRGFFAAFATGTSGTHGFLFRFPEFAGVNIGNKAISFPPSAADVGQPLADMMYSVIALARWIMLVIVWIAYVRAIWRMFQWFTT